MTVKSAFEAAKSFYEDASIYLATWPKTTLALVLVLFVLAVLR